MRPLSSPSAGIPPSSPRRGPKALTLKDELALLRREMKAARGPISEATWIAQKDAALQRFWDEAGPQIDAHIRGRLNLNKLSVSHPPEEVRALYRQHVREQLLTGKVKQIDEPRAFAGTTLTNFISNLGRSQKRRRDDIGHGQFALPLKKTGEPDAEQRPNLDLLPSPVPLEEELVERELHRLVMDALAELHPAFRDTLFLHGVMGMSYEETASSLGVTVGTVKSRINRARAQLRQKPCYQALQGVIVGKRR